MAVEFLTDEQAAGHGRFEGEPSQAELERFFFLDEGDSELVARRRSPYSQLGFAVQLGTARFLGTFLSPDPLDARTQTAGCAQVVRAGCGSFLVAKRSPKLR